MNILKYKYSEIVALVRDGLALGESMRHWEICKALSEGKTLEQVAEDFKMHQRSVAYVKAKKCQCAPM